MINFCEINLNRSCIEIIQYENEVRLQIVNEKLKKIKFQISFFSLYEKFEFIFLKKNNKSKKGFDVFQILFFSRII